MSKDRKGNKKGLEAIFGKEVKQILDEIDGKEPSSQHSEDILIKDIVANPYQPRKAFNDERLGELAQSIKEHGVLSPIMVREATQGKYYLISGERRTRAAKLAQLEKIPAIIKNFDDKIMQEIALVENIQREDLNPIEEALAFKAIIDKQELTQDVFAKRVGKSRSYITNSLRLLNLSEFIIKKVLAHELSFGHVRPLIGLDEELTVKIAKRIIDENLSVRQVEDIVRGYKLKKDSNNNLNNKKETKYERYKYVESLFKRRINKRVKVDNSKIQIYYKDDDELNEILRKLDLLEDV